MRRHWSYLKYVLRHKWYVFWACMEHGVPIWIAILHDWDKFLPDEWFPYARTFYKPNGEKQYVESVEFANAWMLHQHRNKHHWQYWVWLRMILSQDKAVPYPLRETKFLMWDRGDLQQVVKRNSGSAEWLELRDPDADIDFAYTKPMPDVYRREMLADWIGAGKALGKPNTWEWYEANKDKMKLHPDTRDWVERWMIVLQKSAERTASPGVFG